MHWLGYLAIYVIVFSIKDIIRKRSLTKFDNMAVLSLEFSFAFLTFLVIALLLKTPLVLNKYSLTFLGIGILHGLGTVGKINAMNISLSKTTLVSKYNIFVPMLMGFFLLGESNLLHFDSIDGILKIISLILLPISLYLLQKTNGDENKKVSKIWLLSMAQFFIFHATLDYFMKSNIQLNMIIQAGVFQRFSAASITIIAALINKTKFPITKQLFLVSAGNALLISISYFAALSALAVAPLIIYKPLVKMLTVIIITFAGLFIFGEHKEITNRNKWGYIVTGVGVVLLIISEVFSFVS